jgi:hypothetical protein
MIWSQCGKKEYKQRSNRMFILVIQRPLLLMFRKSQEKNEEFVNFLISAGGLQ